MRYLQRLSAKLGVQDSVVFITRFFEDFQLRDIYAASQLVLLPHDQKYGSSSGVLHGAVSSGLPIVVSDSVKFREVTDHIDPALQVATHDPRAWAAAAIGFWETTPTGRASRKKCEASHPL